MTRNLNSSKDMPKIITSGDAASVRDENENGGYGDHHHSDETEDEFYDHDQVLPVRSSATTSTTTFASTLSSTVDPLYASNGYASTLDYSNLSRQFETDINHADFNHFYNQHPASMKLSASLKRKQRRSMFMTITVLFVGVCFVLFVITIVQYSYCNLTSSSASIASGQCQYSRIVSRLNDNLSAINRRLWSVVSAGTGGYRWVSWPIYSPNSNAIAVDPLFSWFFRQYEPN